MRFTLVNPLLAELELQYWILKKSSPNLVALQWIVRCKFTDNAYSTVDMKIQIIQAIFKASALAVHVIKPGWESRQKKTYVT